jgi:hypothetical protein
LTNAIIGNSVTSIGGSTFYSCTSLTSITIPNSVTNIGDEAFQWCYSLTNAIIGNSVTSIGSFAFRECNALINVKLGRGVTSIGSYAFYYCTSLTGVYFSGNAPIIGYCVFNGVNSATVYRTTDAAGWPDVPTAWGGTTTRPTALWPPDLDSDADGIPDLWVFQYFGGATNSNPNAVCSNGINTVLEAYIAGLDPNDSQSRLQISDFRSLTAGKTLGWNAVSGRVYSVYWTTNLLSGFNQCLESNIPWTRSSFTNSTTVPHGYYKINVQLAP